MPTLAATLKSEIKRLTGRELRRALRPLRKVQRQVKKLRLVSREQRRTITALERRMSRLKGRLARRLKGAAGSAPMKGPRVSAGAIRSLRARLRMTREQFARLVRVSPGSIFGWETGRTIPRGASRARLKEIKTMGARAARAEVESSRRGRKAARRRGARRRRRA
jgi:DNA-binding transcriptional regulator YiaG